MASNAENFAPNRVVLDPGTYPDGVLQVFIKGEAEPRLVIDLDGTIRAGDGETAPTPGAGPEVSADEVSVSTDAFTNSDAEDMQELAEDFDAAITAKFEAPAEPTEIQYQTGVTDASLIALLVDLAAQGLITATDVA